MSEGFDEDDFAGGDDVEGGGGVDAAFTGDTVDVEGEDVVELDDDVDREPDRLGIVAFEGFEELDAIGPYEVFQQAVQAGAPLDVEVLATAETDTIGAGHGLTVQPDGVLGADGDLDYLVVPGGGWTRGDDGDSDDTDSDDSQPGARAAANDDSLLATLRTLHNQGVTLLSVCTGGMVLAAAGLLDGRPAITHHGAVADLEATAADVTEARVVDDGDVVTCGGVTAGIDAALWLVEREWGRELAFEVEDVLAYERSTDVHVAE
jgi:transcriptional regulator GlxA family with amidase domain